MRIRVPSFMRLKAVAVAATMAMALPVWAAGESSGELRTRIDARSANDTRGPFAAANSLSPGLASTMPSAAVAEAELRGRWRMFSGNLLLSGERSEGGGTRSFARFNELYASGDFGAWQASAGKKIVGWDVGYGFRPNDFVQQEERRTLLSLTPEGRPLVQVEHFDAESATSFVWVNPQRVHDGDAEQRFGRESALAARWYKRAGAADWHVFGRAGQHTGASVGAAVAWVASDALELHASARALQRHDGWSFDNSAGNAPSFVNPWRVDTQGRASQWLVGVNWTGESQQSVIAEWWHDGTALSDASWDAWGARNAALSTLATRPGLPASALRGLAGNLAWQASPFSASSLRRDNLFVRLAWQPDHWQFTLDALITPADRGRVVTAGVQWQGDRVKLNAAWRVYGGSSESLYAQLPQKQSGVVAASWAF